MASGPIIQWHIDGEIMGTVTDFILGGFKFSADGDYIHEIKKKKKKKKLALWKKSYDKPR